MYKNTYATISYVGWRYLNSGFNWLVRFFPVKLYWRYKGLWCTCTLDPVMLHIWLSHALTNAQYPILCSCFKRFYCLMIAPTLLIVSWKKSKVKTQEVVTNSCWLSHVNVVATDRIAWLVCAMNELCWVARAGFRNRLKCPRIRIRNFVRACWNLGHLWPFIFLLFLSLSPASRIYMVGSRTSSYFT